jgi:hypothetical protein
MSNYSKLFNSGSEGCIFLPKLDCDKPKKKSKKKSKTESSKLLFRFDKTMENEFNINMLVKKIKNHEKWAKIWTEKCMSKNYEFLKNNSEIDTCLDENNVHSYKNINNDTKFNLLQGEYKGITTKQYLNDNFNKKTFQDNDLFIKKFISLFKSLEYLFLGLSELYKHNICHHDLVSRNIIYVKDKFILIDFGLSFVIHKNNLPLKRMNKEFSNGRIYEAYPFEYIYYPDIDNKDIISEQEDIALRFYRTDYKDIYEFIHRGIYRRDIDYRRFELLEDKLHKSTSNKIDPIEMIKLLDTYSLGVVSLIMIIDSAAKHKISNEQLLYLLSLSEIKIYIDFLGKLNTPNYENRINPIQAYEEFFKLI